MPFFVFHFISPLEHKRVERVSHDFIKTHLKSNNMSLSSLYVDIFILPLKTKTICLLSPFCFISVSISLSDNSRCHILPAQLFRVNQDILFHYESAIAMHWNHCKCFKKSFLLAWSDIYENNFKIDENLKADFPIWNVNQIFSHRHEYSNRKLMGAYDLLKY